MKHDKTGMVDEFDTAKKQLEILKCIEGRLSLTPEEVAEDMKDFTVCLLIDNPRGVHILTETINSMKAMLSQQITRLSDTLKEI